MAYVRVIQIDVANRRIQQCSLHDFYSKFCMYRLNINFTRIQIHFVRFLTIFMFNVSN